MNKTNPHSSGKNSTKTLIYLLVSLLLLLLVFTISATLFGLFSSPSTKALLVVLIAVKLLLTIVLSITLVTFFQSVDTVNQQAELLAHGQLNISDIMPEKARGLEIPGVLQHK